MIFGNEFSFLIITGVIRILFRRFRFLNNLSCAKITSCITLGLLICFETVLLCAVSDCTKSFYIHWNTSNPIFRVDNTDHIISVNQGNTQFDYDQVNIICPVYTPGTHEEDAERYIIYNVSKEEYETCRITNPSPRIIAICDKPHKLMYYTITFRPFTPQPGGLEFPPGHDYYFISTSSKDDLHSKNKSSSDNDDDENDIDNDDDSEGNDENDNASDSEGNDEKDNASDSEGNDEGDMLNVQNKLKSNPGWADAMAKILRSKKSLNKKAIVLSKAKKIKDVKPKKVELDFEIVGAENEENEKPNLDELDDKKNVFNRKSTTKECETRGRVKPSILDKDRERTLMKIATKGVVQLFNAVRQQQKTVEKTIKKAGKSELKRERMLESIDKKKFLNVLAGSVKSTPIDNEIKSEEIPSKQKCTWGVLRDDFMMGANLKDWDKQE